MAQQQQQASYNDDGNDDNETAQQQQQQQQHQHYWAEEHDAAAWWKTFQSLVAAAHAKKSKNKHDKAAALAQYRAMRIAVAAQTARMSIINNNNNSLPATKPDAAQVAVTIVGCRGGEAHADPIAVAAYTGLPLLVPVHHPDDAPSADGDLDSVCHRRCCTIMPQQLLQPGNDNTTATAVVRGLESDGYPVLRSNIDANQPTWWPIALARYPHAATLPCSQLLLEPHGRAQLQQVLYEAMMTNKCQTGVVVTSLPFYRPRRSNDKDDAVRATAAQITLDAARQAGLSHLLVAGRNATDTAQALEQALDAAVSDKNQSTLEVILWRGANETRMPDRREHNG